jgi:hypothetical protein
MVKGGRNRRKKRPKKRATKRPTERPTMPVPQAGKLYFGLGRNASYEAAKRGEIPTLRIGARLFAVVAALDGMVGGTVTKPDDRGQSAGLPADAPTRAPLPLTPQPEHRANACRSPPKSGGGDAPLAPDRPIAPSPLPRNRLRKRDLHSDP